MPEHELVAHFLSNLEYCIFWKLRKSSDNLNCQQIEQDQPKLNLTQSCIDLRLMVWLQVAFSIYCMIHTKAHVGNHTANYREVKDLK